MKVIICGAGPIGSGIAEQFSGFPEMMLSKIVCTSDDVLNSNGL